MRLRSMALNYAKDQLRLHRSNKEGGRSKASDKLTMHPERA